MAAAAVAVAPYMLRLFEHVATHETTNPFYGRESLRFPWYNPVERDVIDNIVTISHIDYVERGAKKRCEMYERCFRKIIEGRSSQETDKKRRVTVKE